MANDDLQQRLDKGMYGTPLVNPEEQHKYMGTFRERCRLSMTVAEMKDAQNQKHLLEELAKHPEVTVLLNGEISSDLQSTYIKLLNQHGATFKIVNNFVENNPDSLGLLLAEKHAVDEPVIDVTENILKQQKRQKKSQQLKKAFGKNYFTHKKLKESYERFHL